MNIIRPLPLKPLLLDTRNMSKGCFACHFSLVIGLGRPECVHKTSCVSLYGWDDEEKDVSFLCAKKCMYNSKGFCGCGILDERIMQGYHFLFSPSRMPHAYAHHHIHTCLCLFMHETVGKNIRVKKVSFSCLHD